MIYDIGNPRLIACKSFVYGKYTIYSIFYSLLSSQLVKLNYQVFS